MNELDSILIVDDEPGTVRVLAAVLEDAGYRVETASDGRAALELLQSRPVALVLLDFLMPNLDGCETLRAIRKNRGFDSVRVIMMSGVAESIIKRRCRSPYESFLRKPFSLDELLAAAAPRARIRAAKPKSAPPSGKRVKSRA